MADFHQNGIVATLHKLGDRSLEDLEAELTGYAENSPMALVLPALYSELLIKAYQPQVPLHALLGYKPGLALFQEAAVFEVIPPSDSATLLRRRGGGGHSRA